jgi:hypothetical protein
VHVSASLSPLKSLEEDSTFVYPQLTLFGPISCTLLKKSWITKPSPLSLAKFIFKIHTVLIALIAISVQSL